MTRDELAKLAADISDSRMAMMAALNPQRFTEICDLIGISDDNSPETVVREIKSFLSAPKGNN